VNPTPKDVEVLLFDFGGVIIEIDFDRVFDRWATLAGVPFAQVKSRFTHGEAYQRHERGEIGVAEYFAALRGELGIDLADEDFAEGWAQVFLDEIPSTVEAIRTLAPRMPAYLFSNTNRAHYDLWSVRYADALRPLHGRFISHQMGVRKPEAEAFQRVVREIGVPAGRILFFDDTEANVEGARAHGLQAVRVRSPEDVSSALRPWM
jgi:glucose-1-phosphatase